MADDTGHLLTPVSPTAPAPPAGGGAAPSSLSNVTTPPPATPPASAPHAPFPTATEMMGPPAVTPLLPRSGRSGPSGGNPQFNDPVLPQTPDELLQLITNTPPNRVHHLVPVLDALAGGPLFCPAERNVERPKNARPPSSLFHRLNIGGLSDATVNSGTLGFLYSLTTLLNARSDIRPSDILESCVRFCHVADAYQLFLVPARLTEFAWSFLRVAQQTNRVDITLASLQMMQAMPLQNIPSMFNPVHAVFLEACLYTRQFQLGSSSLNRIYVNALEGTSYLDILTFHHHAGTICAALGDYERATQYFTFSVAMPTTSLSAIQVACGKRAILCELLVTGQQIQFPKDISTVVNRYLDKGMTEYFNLAKAFSNKDWKAAREVAHSAHATFSEDCNFGLVQQIIGSITKRRILILRKTYSRMTVADLTNKVGLSNGAEQEVVAVIQNMIATNEIRATITPSGSSTIVTFIDDGDYVSPENMAKMKQARQLASWLQAELERGNRQIGLDKKWLTKQARSIDTKDKARGAAPDPARKGTFEDDIGPAPVRGVGSNLDDMGF